MRSPPLHQKLPQQWIDLQQKEEFIHRITDVARLGTAIVSTLRYNSVDQATARWKVEATTFLEGIREPQGIAYLFRDGSIPTGVAAQWKDWNIPVIKSLLS